MGFANGKVKFYPNGTQKLTVFNYPRFREVERDKELLPSTYDTNGESRNDSLKRSKDKIFDIAYLNCDEWKYMVTLTLNKDKIDRYDVSGISKYVRKWLQHQVGRKGLKYIIVPELHKDGAVHFHGLINDCDFKFIDSEKRDKQGRVIYNISDWKVGFTTAVALDENKLAVCKYITKYITKGNDKIFGHFYLAGGNIQRDVPFEYIETDYDSYDCPEFMIPNTDIKVKYMQIGGFSDD